MPTVAEQCWLKVVHTFSVKATAYYRVILSHLSLLRSFVKTIIHCALATTYLSPTFSMQPLHFHIA